MKNLQKRKVKIITFYNYNLERLIFKSLKALKVEASVCVCSQNLKREQLNKQEPKKALF